MLSLIFDCVFEVFCFSAFWMVKTHDIFFAKTLVSAVFYVDHKFKPM